MKELTSGVVDDDYDDDDQGSAMIFAPAAMRSTCYCMCGDNLRVRSLCKRLAHIATANFLPARQRREGKGSREGKKGREEKGGIFRFVVSRQPCPPIHAVPTADDTCVVAGCTFIHPCFLFFILHTSSSFHGES
jgi:hypothetical protein